MGRLRGRRLIAVALLAVALPTIGGSPPAGADIGEVVRVSTGSHGEQLTAGSVAPVVSAGGRYVAFASAAPYGEADTNETLDVFRKDLETGMVELVSVALDGGTGSSTSSFNGFIDISDDGTKIVFESFASNLVEGDDNGRQDIFVRDLVAGTTIRVNVGDGGALPDADHGALGASMSASGDRVAFVSYSMLPQSDGTSSPPGLYVHDLPTRETTHVGPAAGAAIALSGDGGTVAFLANGGGYRVEKIHLATGATTVLNPDPGGEHVDVSGLAGPNALSHDGSVALFASHSDELVTPDANEAADVFLNVDGVVRRISQTADGVEGDGSSGFGRVWGALDAAGERAAFTTAAPNLGGPGAMAADLATGALEPASIAPDGTPRPSGWATISPDGATIGFASHASDLVSDDTNGVSDVFVARRAASTELIPTELSLTVDEASTLPGASTVDPLDVPITALPLGSLDTIADAPLRSVDISSSPLRSVPLRSVPLRSVPLRSVPLRSVTLSELPLHGATWETILATLSPNPFVGVPLQAITLDEVLAADPAGLATIALEDIDLSSTPLRSVSLASIALGATPLRSVPVPGTQPTVFGNWCELLTSLGFDCADLELTEDSPILAVDLAGVPLRSVPLRSVPLRSVDLSSAPLRSVPLRSVPLRSVPIGTILLGDIVPTDAVVDCTMTDCGASRTLADAADDGAILETASLGTLFDAVDQDLLPGSLLELLQAFIEMTSLPWEDLPVEEIGVHEFAGEGRREVTYQASFTAAGGGEAPATATVELPMGFLYVPGSTTTGETTSADPTVDGRILTWDLGEVAGGTSPSFSFRAVPSLRLADTAMSTLTVTLGEATATATDQAAVAVLEDFELSNVVVTDRYLVEYDTCCFEEAPAPASPVIEPNTLVLSHIGTPGDVDQFLLPVPEPGTRIQIRLGSQDGEGDYDVLLLGGPDTAPLRSVPLRSVPLRSVPIPDQGIDSDAADESLPSELLSDIPTPEGVPLRSVSDNRGSAAELIDTVTHEQPEDGDYYTIQVTGYDGWSSDVGYTLFVRQYDPPPPPDCGPRVFPFAGAGTDATAPTLPATVNTLILTNTRRLAETYGADAASAVITAAESVAARDDLGVHGVVYPVDSSPAVAAAYAAWDAEPCDPALANAAFSTVADVVDEVRAAHPELANVVVLGGDDIIPMARIADYTHLSNEADYASGTVGGSGDHHPISASAVTQHFLSDDPLVDFDPIPWLDHELFVPDVAVGRLVESPAALIAQLQLFEASNGVLDPQTALTTGYDFLTDGANAVDAALGSRIPDAQRQRLVNETWSRADLAAAMFPVGGESPDVATVNAHYDHNRSLPALGNSTLDESDLFTVADVDAHPDALVLSVLFTMGCHAGLPVPDAYLADGDERAVDWVQTYLSDLQQAAVYFANTTFGYGDTAAVALSEELMRLFGERLDGSMTVGDAARYAKQAYFGAMGTYGPYDEKALQGAAFYGLPMYRIGTASPAPGPAPAGVEPAADAHGIASAPVTVTPTFEEHRSAGGGTYFTVDGEAQVTQYRPIVPRTSVDVTPADPSLVAHGFLLRSLTSTDDLVVPSMARPVIDLSTSEPPPPAGDVAFPTSFSNLALFDTPDGDRQHLVLLPGQVFRDASWTGGGAVSRLFREMGGEVKYSTSSDYTPPFLTQTQVASLDGGIEISVSAVDSTGAVVEVLALVNDGDGAWQPVTLSPVEGQPGRYAGFTEVSSDDWELFVQAMDDAGNVGITTDKGTYFLRLSPAGETAEDGAPVIRPDAPRPTGTNGWYDEPVAVAVEGPAGTTLAVDGGPAEPYSSPVLLGDGIHAAEATAPSGAQDFGVFAVDSTPPAITAAVSPGPNENGWYRTPPTVSFACVDEVSGVRSCTDPVIVVDDTAGTDVAGKAIDFAGHAATTSASVRVDRTAPEVTVTGVSEGASYDLGAAPTPGCTASDELSGLDGTCAVTVTGGNANGVGTFVATATATDLAGNVGVAVVTYHVRYVFSGFLPPINNSGHGIDENTSVFKAGSTIPVRFELRDAHGSTVEAAALPLWLTPVRISPTSAPVNDTASEPSASSGSSFGFDGTTYQFNWKTSGDQAGWYWRIGVQLDDGSVHVTYIGLR